MSLAAFVPALLRSEVLVVMALAAVMAGALYLRSPGDRGSLRNTLVLGLAGLAGIAAAAAMHGRGYLDSSAVVREVFIVVVGLALIRLTGQCLFRVALPLAGLRPPRIMEDLLVMVAYVGWGFVRLRFAGLDLSGIVATSAVITAIVAFSVQDTLGNILGGLALELDSGFEVGDWIRVDEVTGKVADVRWRSVSIETRNGETVVVPNSHMVRSKVIVLGRRVDGRLCIRRWIVFGVPLSTSPARVIGVVEGALRAASIDGVSAEPTPNCVLQDFERGNGRYALRYWLTDLERDDATDSAVREHLLAALQRAGLRIAVPDQQVHVVAEDRVHAEQVAERELARRMEALRGIELFGELTDDELRTLAAGLESAPFASGDLVTRQGAVAHWLYVLTAGRVEVALEDEMGARHAVAQLEAPTVFGEMGLLTGEPRHATVIARSACECYRLGKAAFEAVLVQRPALAERMSHILAERQGSLERRATDIAALAEHAARHTRASGEILTQIKRFFGIAAG